jgi:hypothetical protein
MLLPFFKDTATESATPKHGAAIVVRNGNGEFEYSTKGDFQVQKLNPLGLKGDKSVVWRLLRLGCGDGFVLNGVYLCCRMEASVSDESQFCRLLSSLEKRRQ